MRTAPCLRRARHDGAGHDEYRGGDSTVDLRDRFGAGRRHLLRILGLRHRVVRARRAGVGITRTASLLVCAPVFGDYQA